MKGLRWLFLGVVVLALGLGYLLSPVMNRFFPGYGMQVFVLSFLLFVFGIGYGILERSRMAVILTLISLLVVPFFVRNFIYYWPMAKRIFFGK